MPLNLIVLIFSLCTASRIDAGPYPLMPASTRYAPCIVLDPSGDSEHAGRKLEEHFERGIALQCIECVQQELEGLMPHARIMLTKTPGLKVQPLHHAQFTNKIGADLHIHIAFYHHQESSNQWHLYRFSDGNGIVSPQEPTLLKYTNAYQHSAQQTRTVADKLYALLQQSAHTSTFTVHPPVALPHKALLGITQPAITIEVGLQHDHEWSECARILAQALYTMLDASSMQ